jgi:ABC-2 type transport system permease protein
VLTREIEPTDRKLQCNMKYTQLVMLLVSRDLTLRYKRSAIGIGWTLLNPILTSLVLWLVFSYVFASKLPGDQQFAPYLMAGILLNSFFNQSLIQSAESIAGNAGLLTKIYIPPQIFAVSASLAAFVNFVIGLIPLTLVVFVSGQSLAWTLPLTLFIGACMTLFASGIGLSLATLYVRFDDMRNIVNVLLMTLMYFTPVFYPVSILPPKLQSVIQLNPLTSFLDNFRWAFSNNAISTSRDWIFMFSVSVFAFFFGVVVFKKYWPRTVAML